MPDGVVRRVTFRSADVGRVLGLGFLFLFLWVRWTLPRFRFDQLMALGWKVMLPLALFNLFLTGALVSLGVL